MTSEKFLPTALFLKPLSRLGCKYIYHEMLPEQTLKLESCLPADINNFHTLLTSSMGRNCQHAILRQTFLINLISPSLSRPCCLAFLGHLHRSCSLLQSLHQSKIVVLQPLLHKVAYETLSQGTENTYHNAEYTETEVFSRPSRMSMVSTAYRGAEQTTHLL